MVVDNDRRLTDTRAKGRTMTEKAVGSVRRSFAPWNDPNAKPYIQFENVTKKFGDFTAVNNLSLTIFERDSLSSPSY